VPVPAVPVPAVPVPAVPPVVAGSSPPQASRKLATTAEDTVRTKKSLRFRELEDIFDMFLLRGQPAPEAT
jgi:hypothetical protein